MQANCICELFSATYKSRKPVSMLKSREQKEKWLFYFGLLFGTIGKLTLTLSAFYAKKEKLSL